MRPLWSGAISFGLVNIPVKLYSGSQSHSLDLDMLHSKDMSPIRYARVCREDGKEVPWDEIVKGYEYRKNDYVVLTKEDFAKADPGRQETLDILSFAEEREVPPAYFDKPYYLEPAKGAAKVYSLLCEALAESGKVAIAKYVLRNREHLGCIRPANGMLMMIQMRFGDEVRSTDEINIPKKVKISKDEMKLANELIRQLTRPFDPFEYKDTYQDELERIVEEKVAGEVPKAASAPKKAEVKDLMAALRKSLDQGKKANLYLVHDSTRSESRDEDSKAPKKRAAAKTRKTGSTAKAKAGKKTAARSASKKSAPAKKSASRKSA